MLAEDKELRERWDRDAPKCWQIMPFYLPRGETEWWVMENLKSIMTLSTMEEAFRIAYEHNSRRMESMRCSCVARVARTGNGSSSHEGRD